MRADLAALDGHTFDLVVLGGGIHAATIASAGAAAGLLVLLVEAEDFASDVPLGSPGLLDAAVRSLHLAANPGASEALIERERLLRALPQLVRPLPIFWPGRRESLPDRAWRTESSTLPEPRWIRPEDCSLEYAGLTSVEGGVGSGGGLLFFDARVDEVRWILHELRQAKSAGAQVINYCQVQSRSGDSLRLRDRLSGAEISITQHHLVDASSGRSAETSQLLGHDDSIYGAKVEVCHSHWPTQEGDCGICAWREDHLVVAVPTPEGTITTEPWTSDIAAMSISGMRRCAASSQRVRALSTDDCVVVVGHDLLGTRSVVCSVFDALKLPQLTDKDAPRFFELCSEEVGDPLWWRHGQALTAMRELIEQQPSLGEPLRFDSDHLPDSDILCVEVIWAVRELAAMTFEDLVLRRLAPKKLILAPEELMRAHQLLTAELSAHGLTTRLPDLPIRDFSNDHSALVKTLSAAKMDLHV